MERTLPFNMEPECRAYQNRAFELGIIKANLKDYNCWLSNKLINCICIHNDDYPYFEMIEEDIWELNHDLAERQTIYIKPEVLQNGLIQLVDLVRYMLQSGHYVIGFYDEYYVPGKEAYGEYEFWHDYVIYGYDDEKRVFKSAGYLKEKNYDTFEIGYEDYFNAVCHLGRDNVDLWFYRIKNDYEPKFKVGQVIQQMNNYLNSVHKPKEDETKNTYYFGISAWEMYADHVLNENYHYMDLRFSRTFMEHKVIMLNRLQVMYEEDYLNDYELIIQYKREIVERAKIVHLLCIKYNLTEKNKIRVQLHDLIHRINQCEIRILGMIVKLVTDQRCL